jgi:hypothetical protein
MVCFSDEVPEREDALSQHLRKALNRNILAALDTVAKRSESS